MLINKRTPTSSGSNKRESLLPAPFIVGVPRSGTTLLRLMLDAHPALAIPPEFSFPPRLVEKIEMASNSKDYLVEKLTTRARWSDFHINAKSFSQKVDDLNPFNISDALRTFYKLYAERFGKPRWGDKTTKNTARMSFIQTLLPEAHFIHIIRDGRDAASSISRLYFGPNSMREAATWWVSKILEARAQANNLMHYMEIRFEDLVLHTESTLKEICRFIDLSWDPAMLDYYKTSAERLNELQDVLTHDSRALKAEDRRGKHCLTSKPPQKERIGCGRNEMSDADREWFENIAGETLQDLGYEVGPSQEASNMGMALTKS